MSKMNDVFRILALNGFLSMIVLGATHGSVQASELIQKEFRIEFESPIFLVREDFVVTDADVDSVLMARVPETDRVGFLSSADRIGNLLTQVLLAEAALSRARDEGLLDDVLIQARLRRVLNSEVLSLYREQFLSNVELESYESMARELHITQPRQFMTPGLIDFEHILIEVKPKRTEVEAMAIAIDLHSRLSGGEDFSSVAKHYSDDPSVSDNNGFLTGVNPADLVPQIATLLAEATMGRYSDPVRTRFGWHLVRLVEVHPGQQMSWEEARPQAESFARQRHRTLAWERVLRDFQNGQVEFAEGAVARLLDRHGAKSEDDAHSTALEQMFEETR